MSSRNEKETKDFNLNESVENVSSEVTTYITHSHSKAQENLTWLQNSMHPYFFAALRDSGQNWSR